MDFKKRVIPYDIIGEMIDDVITRAYHKLGTVPNQIIVFREGISEGQFPEMYSKEITAIKKTIKGSLREKFEVESEIRFPLRTKGHHRSSGHTARKTENFRATRAHALLPRTPLPKALGFSVTRRL